MIRIEESLLDKTAAEAISNPRKRKNYNFHPDYEAPLQRLLNAIEPGSYIRPHLHSDPDKNEIFIVLRGRFLVVEFDRAGNIRESMLLDVSKGQFGAEIPPSTYHMLISLETGSVAYEFKEGPFIPSNAKSFAPWAPPEGSEAAQEYLDNILEQCAHQAG